MLSRLLPATLVDLSEYNYVVNRITVTLWHGHESPVFKETKQHDCLHSLRSSQYYRRTQRALFHEIFFLRISLSTLPGLHLSERRRVDKSVVTGSCVVYGI